MGAAAKRNLVLVGCGKMGSLIFETAKEQGYEVLAMVDKENCAILEDIKEPVDAVLDFSHPDNLSWMLPYVKKQHAALVCGTTGLSEEQRRDIEALGAFVPVIYSANYSYGIAVLASVLSRIAPLLEDTFDMELIEAHHNQKQDAPSGTAKLLLEKLDPKGEFRRVYGREGMIGKRGKEIGVHAVRGGTVAGEHTVLFLGDHERLELKHTAESRQIFVNGALRAAAFLIGRPNGVYTMADLLENASV